MTHYNYEQYKRESIERIQIAERERKAREAQQEAQRENNRKRASNNNV